MVRRYSKNQETIERYNKMILLKEYVLDDKKNPKILELSNRLNNTGKRRKIPYKLNMDMLKLMNESIGKIDIFKYYGDVFPNEELIRAKYILDITTEHFSDEIIDQLLKNIMNKFQNKINLSKVSILSADEKIVIIIWI